MTLEQKLKNLYEEFNVKKNNGIPVDKEIYRRRRRALEIAEELRVGHEKKDM